MNKKIKQSYLFILSVLLITIGCNNDDDATTNIEVSLEDLEVTIDENPTNGQVIGTIQANGSTSGFDISSQSPSGALGIDPSSGELTVADASLFDYESNPTITATVSTNNAESPASVTITLNNVNEVTAQSLEVTIDENPADGQVIGALQASGSTSGFTITSQSPTGAMGIDSGTGELTVADASLFDYESNPVLTATVSMADAENPVTVTVNLDNVFEITIQDFTEAIDENPTDGQVIGTLQTSGGTAANFSITSQTPAGAMSIDANTGELTAVDPNLFDFETNPIITATVTADDVENPATVTINLNNVAELSAQNLTTSIDENPTDGQVVGTIQVNGSGTLSFTITSQTPADALSIDAGTGELSVVDPNLFDYEINPTITANILVDNGVETATVTATINLNDVDEITVQTGNFTIDENPANGDVIGTLQASAGSALTYTITFQNPAGAFNIDPNTGELSVADGTLFDYETNSNMLATISVDNGTYSVSANAFVALNDLNEVGEFRYGGVIFWVDPADNGYGLVSAITDQSTGATWGCQGTLISGTSTSFASGETNTAAIIAGCATPGIAADIAVNTTTGGYSDWFLPSWNQLNAMYANKAIIDATATANGGTAFPASMFYWSSSESNSNTAWAVFFDNGSGGGYNKGASANFRVRVVRVFDVAN